jgi:CxxC motif-containing protein (DUF1111 family)
MRNNVTTTGAARGIVTIFLVWVLVELASAGHNKPPLLPPRIPQPTPDPTVFGAPLPGLTAQQLQQFAVGLAQFKTVDTVSDGLGPVFNGQSCVACHAVPAAGGSSAITETRFGQLVNGVFNQLTGESGTLLHQSCIIPSVQMSIPLDANVVAQRKSTPLFGLGLIETIPDREIIANVHKPAVDGITGAPAMIVDAASGATRVGRFGWKAQQATLLTFSGDAYLNEVGITSRIPGFTEDIAPDGNQSALLAVEPSLTGYYYNQVQDLPNGGPPQTDGGTADVDEFNDFMLMLANPPILPLNRSAQEGQKIFTQINCVACHKPQMTTGPSSIAALNFKPVPLYSDLLLHDMGTLGDGIVQGAASASQMRTQPLWGLRARAPYLHDGRAKTIFEAVQLHDGEAAIVRNRFLALPAGEQQALIDFLNSI